MPEWGVGLGLMILLAGCDTATFNTFCFASEDGDEPVVAGEVVKVRGWHEDCTSSSGITQHGGECSVELDGDVIRLSGSIRYSARPVLTYNEDCNGIGDEFDCASEEAIEAGSYTVEIVAGSSVIASGEIEVDSVPRYGGCCLSGSAEYDEWTLEDCR